MAVSQRTSNDKDSLGEDTHPLLTALTNQKTEVSPSLFLRQDQCLGHPNSQTKVRWLLSQEVATTRISILSTWAAGGRPQGRLCWL